VKSIQCEREGEENRREEGNKMGKGKGKVKLKKGKKNERERRTEERTDKR
jgi:hypothetical protein